MLITSCCQTRNAGYLKRWPATCRMIIAAMDPTWTPTLVCSSRLLNDVSLLSKLGRRRVKPSVEARIKELRAKGDGILKIGRTLGVGTSVVQRVVSAATPLYPPCPSPRATILSALSCNGPLQRILERDELATARQRDRIKGDH
jgi:hypothetical protein